MIVNLSKNYSAFGCMLPSNDINKVLSNKFHKSISCNYSKSNSNTSGKQIKLKLKSSYIKSKSGKIIGYRCEISDGSNANIQESYFSFPKENVKNRFSPNEFFVKKIVSKVVENGKVVSERITINTPKGSKTVDEKGREIIRLIRKNDTSIVQIKKYNNDDLEKVYWYNTKLGLIVETDSKTGIAFLKNQTILSHEDKNNMILSRFGMDSFKNKLADKYDIMFPAIKDHVGTEYSFSYKGLFGGHYSESYNRLKTGDLVKMSVKKADGSTYQTRAMVQVSQNGNISLTFSDDAQKSHNFLLKKVPDKNSGAVLYEQIFDNTPLSTKKTVVPKSAYEDMFRILYSDYVKKGYYRKLADDNGLFAFKTDFDKKSYYWAITINGKTCYPLTYDAFQDFIKKSKAQI